MGNARITLRELKAMLPATTGRKLPSPRYLRENDTLVARAEVMDCVIEVYGSGFAVCRNSSHFCLIRMEHVGRVAYESEQDDWRSTVDVEDLDWTIGVMLCGEERMERQYRDKAESSIVSLTGASPDEDGADMEIDAGVDVLEEVVSEDECLRMMETLTPRQREVVQMHFFEGMTQEEIAQKLNRKKQSVNESISWALKKIQNFF